MLPATEYVCAHLVAAPVDAGGAGVGGEPACPVHDVQLAVVTAFVGRGEPRDRILGAAAGLEQRQALGPVVAG